MGRKSPESIDIESTDDVTGEAIYGTIPRTDWQDDGADWWEGGLEQWVKYRWNEETSQWVFEVGDEKFFRQRPMTVHGLMVVKIRFCNRSIWMEHSIKLLELHGIVRAGRKQMAAGGNP